MSETKSKGGRTSEYAGKVFAVIAAKEAIKGYKSKSPAVEAAVKAILAVKNSTKVAAAVKSGESVLAVLGADKKAPKVDTLLGLDVDFVEKDGSAKQVKLATAHIRRVIAEGLVVVA
jgi:hypothetical protein